MARSFRLNISSALVLVVGVTTTAAAQECVGIPQDTRGYFSYGMEGTDGATGEGFTVGVRLGQGLLQVQRGTLEPVTVVDDIESLHLQGAYPISKKLPVCLTAGFGWTGYDTDRINGWSTDGQGNITHDGTAGGPYLRLRMPVGISLGKEFKVSENTSAVGFVSNSLLYDFERYERPSFGREQRHAFGVAAAVGVTLNYRRIMLRSSLSNFTTLNGNSVDQYNDFPFMSLQLGIKF